MTNFNRTSSLVSSFVEVSNTHTVLQYSEDSSSPVILCSFVCQEIILLLLMTDCSYLAGESLLRGTGLSCHMGPPLTLSMGVPSSQRTKPSRGWDACLICSSRGTISPVSGLWSL